MEYECENWLILDFKRGNVLGFGLILFFHDDTANRSNEHEGAGGVLIPTIVY